MPSCWTSSRTKHLAWRKKAVLPTTADSNDPVRKKIPIISRGNAHEGERMQFVEIILFWLREDRVINVGTGHI